MPERHLEAPAQLPPPAGENRGIDGKDEILVAGVAGAPYEIPTGVEGADVVLKPGIVPGAGAAVFERSGGRRRQAVRNRVVTRRIPEGTVRPRPREIAHPHRRDAERQIPPAPQEIACNPPRLDVHQQPGQQLDPVERLVVAAAGSLLARTAVDEVEQHPRQPPPGDLACVLAALDVIQSRHVSAHKAQPTGSRGRTEGRELPRSSPGRGARLQKLPHR